MYEYEGRDVNVSKRSIQLDIQLMRSDKLGYNAPIVVYDKKYYKYEEEDYSIMNIPLTESDMNVLTETVEMLKQFKDFSLFSELGDIIQRLEDKVYSEKSHQPSIIHLDKNDNLKGLQHLDTLYQAILKKLCLQITYKSFRAREASVITFHPYILKQFNNRWFLVGRMFNNQTIQVLALDRIVEIDFDLKTEYKMDNFDGDTYFQHTIGVTVLTDLQLASIILKFDQSNAPYVLTKPLHHSQKLIEKFADGSITVELYVHLNYELERLILGFGETVEVLAPRNLRGKIKKKLRLALGQYE